MNEWTDLPNLPRRYSGEAGPTGSALRIVRGATAMKDGREQLLSGIKAYAQRLKLALIEAYRAKQDVPSAVEEVLAAHAKHLDVVEWCKYRGEEIDLALRVYTHRGVVRIHAALGGPLGQFAEDPLPEHAAPSARPKKARATAESPQPAASARTERDAGAASAAARSTTSLIQEPTRRSLRGRSIKLAWIDSLGFAPDGQLFATLLRDEQSCYARIDPRLDTVHEPLPTRDELRAERPTALTPARCLGFLQLPDALVRVEFFSEAGDREYERFRVSSAEGERTTIMNKPSAGRLADHAIGLWGSRLVRLLVDGKKVKLELADLSNGKTSSVAIDGLSVVLGVAVERTAEGGVLRILAPGEEHRVPFRVGAKLEIDASNRSMAPCSVEGSASPAPGGGWFTCRGGELRFASSEGAETVAFRVPEAFGAMRPFTGPRVTDLDDGAALVVFRFIEDIEIRVGYEARTCVGAVVVRGGETMAIAHSDAPSGVRVNSETYPTAGPPVSFAGRANGELAVLTADLSVFWHPPTTSRADTSAN